MLLPTLVLALGGIALFLLAPLIARLAMRGRDPMALTRILQLVAVLMLVGALFIKPYNPDNTAIPPPPDMADPRAE